MTASPVLVRSPRKTPALRAELLEARITPAETKFFDNHTVALIAETRPEVQEPAAPVYLDGRLVAQGNVLKGIQLVPGTGRFPEVWAHIANGNVRGTYLKADGTSGTETSSVIGTFSARTTDGFFVYPVVDRYDVHVAGNTVTVTVTARLGDLGTETITTTHPPAGLGKTEATTTVTFTVGRAITLDPAQAGNDALRGPTVSSMYTPDGHDTSAVTWTDQYGVGQQLRLTPSTPTGSHLFGQPQSLGTSFTAVNEPGSPVHPDGPSAQVTLLGATIATPNKPPGPLTLGLQGFLASGTTGDDTLGFWPEVINPPATLDAGTVLGTTIRETFTPPRALSATLSAPKVLGPVGVNQDRLPAISWSPVYGADHYQLRVFRGLNAMPSINEPNVAGTSFTATTKLPQGVFSTYVRTVNAAGVAGPWSAAGYFTVDVPAPARPTVTAPAAGSVVKDPNPTVTWSGTADTFRVRVDDLTAATSFVVYRGNLPGPSFTLPALAINHLYRVYVRGVNEVGELSPWSAGVSFTADAYVDPAGVLSHLRTGRNAIAYAPRHYNPNLGLFPTEDQIRADLRQLYREGWRVLFCYTLDGTLAAVPRIAKEIGFAYVIASIYWYDDAQLGREYPAAVAAKGSVDLFVVGGEGLQFGRYTLSALQNVMGNLRTDTGKPVTTYETGGYFLNNPSLLGLGDGVILTTIHPWYSDPPIRDVPTGVTHTADEYHALQAAAPAGTLVYIIESWWPAATKDPTRPIAGASPANQLEYYRMLSGTDLRFAWGEYVDEPWKNEAVQWGLHTADGTPRAVINRLGYLYRGRYEV